MKTLLALFSLSLLISCGPKTLKSPVYNTTVFRGERGEKEVTKFNKKKADREKTMAEAIERADAAQRMLEEQQATLAAIDTTQRMEGLDENLSKLFEKTQAIVNELNAINPYTSEGHQKALELSAELNDLMYNQIQPIGELIESNKDVVRIGSDISFESGSDKLSKEGKSQVTTMVKKIENDIEGWKAYLNHHNENIFNDKEYRTVLVINGYADAMGNANEEKRKSDNLELSEKRAKAVAEEFERQLNTLFDEEKITIKFEIHGRGEELPPNYTPSAKLNDEGRRICNINMVVGPKMLMFNEE